MSFRTEPGKYRCKDCLFYRSGNCFRYPPTVYNSLGDTYSIFPEVNLDDWCGELTLKQFCEDNINYGN